MAYSYDRKFKFLLVENDEDWIKDLSKCIRKGFAGFCTIHVARSLEKAQRAIKEKRYDLITIDLKLDDAISDDFSGKQLLAEIRENSRSADAALIILSGFPTEENLIETLDQEFNVDKFIRKNKFNCKEFTKTAGKSLLKTLLRRHKNESKKRSIITLELNKNGLLHKASIKGKLADERTLAEPLIFDLRQYAELTNNIGYLITQTENAKWHSAAQQVGKEIFRKIITCPEITKMMGAASADVAKNSIPLYLQFTAPVNCLNIPFELMFNKDFLVFENVITRCLSEGMYIPNSFANLIRELDTEPLKITVIGSNYGDEVYNFEKEAKAITKTIETNLKLLEIPKVVSSLIGRKATYENFVHSLEDGCHIFHFAGHSYYSEDFPEESSLCFYDKDVPAVQIKNLLQRNAPHFVFLSSCLGAKVDSEIEKEGLYGFMDSLFEAGVTTILGYRWKVKDDSAYLFSRYFYETLFRTLCPAKSLFIARNQTSLELGRSADVWASPIMLTQPL